MVNGYGCLRPTGSVLCVFRIGVGHYTLLMGRKKLFAVGVAIINAVVGNSSRRSSQGEKR